VHTYVHVPAEIVYASGFLPTRRAHPELAFNSAYDDHYTELSYTGDLVSSVDIWEDSGKTTKLFTRTLSYSGVNVISVVTVDEIASNTLTKTLAYSGDNITSITTSLT